MPKTVFVVDDNDTNLQAAKNALKEHCRVMTLPSAAKMFSFIERLTPDLILLDIEMPDMDGFETLGRLRETPAYAEIPVVFLSGSVSGELEEKSKSLGAKALVAKPFDTDSLLALIERLTK